MTSNIRSSATLLTPHVPSVLPPEPALRWPHRLTPMSGSGRWGPSGTPGGTGGLGRRQKLRASVACLGNGNGNSATHLTGRLPGMGETSRGPKPWTPS